MTLTPRPFFWTVTTRGGAEVAAGVGMPGWPLPRLGEQVVAGGRVYQVGQVRWAFSEGAGPVTCAIQVEIVSALYEGQARSA